MLGAGVSVLEPSIYIFVRSRATWHERTSFQQRPSPAKLAGTFARGSTPWVYNKCLVLKRVPIQLR